MSSRAYMLLDILKGKASGAMQILKTFKGVVTADTLEGHPNILVIMEASDRQKLVELMTPVLDSVDHVTEDVRLLINREVTSASVFDMPSAELSQKQSVN